MKIMTFNILVGGINENSSRIDAIIKVINDENPDFLAIQEANDFDKNDFELLKKVNSDTDLPFFEFSEGAPYEDGEQYHVASLSKTPLTHVHTFSDSSFSHGGLATTIDSPVGELTLCNVHLHSRSENERLSGIQTVLSYLSQFEKNIILGDCNALSKSDRYNDLTTEEFTHYGLNRFDATNLLNSNHVDSARLLKKDDMRTHPTIGVGHPISKTPIRIDYIFASKPLVGNLKDIHMIKTETAEIASDHYPIALSIE